MRIRTIKPEFFLHAELYDAEETEKLPLRIAFIGLWCAADREGRFKWEPRRLKAQIMPYDNCDFSRVLHALATRGFLVHYASNGQEFGLIPSFARHQVINNRESESVLPQCDDSAKLLTRAPRVPHACPTPLNLDQGEGKGREWKGMEGRERNGREEEGPLSLALAASSGDDSADLAPDSRKTEEAPDASPILETFACAGTVSAWHFRQNFRDELAKLFPAVDVLREAQIAKAKIERNAVPKKTARGMPRFLMSWMERSQNSARLNVAQQKPYVGAFR